MIPFLNFESSLGMIEKKGDRRTNEQTNERMNGRTDKRTKVRTNGQTNGQKNRQTNGQMNRRTDGVTLPYLSCSFQLKIYENLFEMEGQKNI